MYEWSMTAYNDVLADATPTGKEAPRNFNAGNGGGAAALSLINVGCCVRKSS